MATGSLLVLPRFQAFKNGVFSAGALLNFYEAGTLVRRNTYSDSALTSVNANPVVCDAYGLAGPIYLLPAAYKLVVTDSAGVEIFSQDNLLPSQLATFDAVDPKVCDGRLTLESGVPVSTSDQTAKTSVYFANYGGNRIALYNSTYSRWELHSFSELSIALGTDAASIGYDVFAYVNAGAVAIERLAWTNGTTRATGLTTQNGVRVKSGDPTRRYLGSYYTTAIGQTEDSFTKRMLWNEAHRVERPMRRLESTDSWTYTTAAFRQANASASNQLACFVGVIEDAVDVEVHALALNSTASVQFSVSIGHSSVLTPATGVLMQFGESYAANDSVGVSARLRTFPTLGYQYFAWLEYSLATGVTTWQGDAGTTYVQSGMTGVVLA